MQTEDKTKKLQRLREVPKEEEVTGEGKLATHGPGGERKVTHSSDWGAGERSPLSPETGTEGRQMSLKISFQQTKVNG